MSLPPIEFTTSLERDESPKFLYEDDDIVTSLARVCHMSHIELDKANDIAETAYAAYLETGTKETAIKYVEAVEVVREFFESAKTITEAAAEIAASNKIIKEVSDKIIEEVEAAGPAAEAVAEAARREFVRASAVAHREAARKAAAGEEAADGAAWREFMADYDKFIEEVEAAAESAALSNAE